MAGPVLEVEKDGYVGRIWLNRPHKRNCVTVEMLELLQKACDDLDEDSDIRVVVVRGRGGTFCSGFDLDDLQSDYVGHTDGLEVAYKSARICNRLFNMRKPSVAVLEGYTTAGGFEIMVSCDFAVAVEDALIGDFHMRRGLFGGAGPIYRVPRMIGLRKAKELMLSGKLLTGAEAKEWGLVNEIAPADLLDQKVEAFVAQFADKSPFTMWITKMATDRSLDADTETLMVLEHLAVGVVLQSDDAQEGVSAFLEKREPKWTGR